MNNQRGIKRKSQQIDAKTDAANESDKRQKFNQERQKRDNILKSYEWSDARQTFTFIHGSQCRSGGWGLSDPLKMDGVEKKCPCYITWEEAQFLIEFKYGFHSQHRKMNSRIEGRLWQPEMKNWREESEVIDKSRIMQPVDRVIVLIYPLRPWEKLNVPQTFRHLFQTAGGENETREELKLTDDMSEDKKIETLLKIQENRIKNISIKTINNGNNGNNKHYNIKYTDVLTKPENFIPNSDYTCHRCGHKGHFINYCPTNNDPDFIPLSKRGCPSGIPKNRLRVVTDPTEIRKAWITMDGQFVLLKDDIPMVDFSV